MHPGPLALVIRHRQTQHTAHLLRMDGWKCGSVLERINHGVWLALLTLFKGISHRQSGRMDEILWHMGEYYRILSELLHSLIMLLQCIHSFSSSDMPSISSRVCDILSFFDALKYIFQISHLVATIISCLSRHFELKPLVRTYLVGVYFTRIAFRTLLFDGT